ncbi:helix-turn-helix domain-containing protein [Streptococcus iniae]|uniref:XRE family transcriptional regulator n=1 Tax=Streptococcus iniae TaxID=1346 RepID=A0A3L8GNL6_STRIN|nr:helix-turn-helix transcriptional regulator [Streptococcus iniae]AGM98259.1 transcriptional regulator [Streptococcus iniae SF1]AHY15313.1 XRE family transcriptional regulator [Streptococcus iniae]AHY17180.1 XRE family transcriptional regulator [Streptococcus iniae]AJG25490.1 XRE family transcriptional regulator [Streptococcus iniae]APD31359.1 transcriptional regulator [Streptococcus iniae]
MTMLSEKFRLKRKELGFSQHSLAEGICEQSQISKIERGSYMPSADLLFRLAKRLEVPLDYFFNDDIEVKSNLSHFKQLSSRLLDDRNYSDLEYIYNLELDKNHILCSEDSMYLEWIKAIIDFYHYNKKNEAISHLEKLLTNLSSKTVIYLRILNTLSNFYSLIGRDLEYKKNYLLLIEIYQEKDFTIQEFLFGYIRIRYNYAHHLISKKDYSEAMQVAFETIELCKLKQTSYQLAPLLILVANAGEHFLEYDQVTSYLLEAKYLCKIYGDQLMLMTIESYLSERQKKRENNH